MVAMVQVDKVVHLEQVAKVDLAELRVLMVQAAKAVLVVKMAHQERVVLVALQVIVVLRVHREQLH
jgi:hypothetical protein